LSSTTSIFPFFEVIMMGEFTHIYP
jgi:hypothetical protein